MRESETRSQGKTQKIVLFIENPYFFSKRFEYFRPRSTLFFHMPHMREKSMKNPLAQSYTFLAVLRTVFEKLRKSLNASNFP